MRNKEQDKERERGIETEKEERTRVGKIEREGESPPAVKKPQPRQKKSFDE